MSPSSARASRVGEGAVQFRVALRIGHHFQLPGRRRQADLAPPWFGQLARRRLSPAHVLEVRSLVRYSGVTGKSRGTSPRSCGCANRPGTLTLRRLADPSRRKRRRGQRIDASKPCPAWFTGHESAFGEALSNGFRAKQSFMLLRLSPARFTWPGRKSVGGAEQRPDGAESSFQPGDGLKPDSAAWAPHPCDIR